VPACQRAGWTLASGFEVEDLGTLSLNPMTAAMLGIAGALSAKRIATDDRIDIQIRTADGLIPSRFSADQLAHDQRDAGRRRASGRPRPREARPRESGERGPIPAGAP
jgi:hypothetical protein